MKWADERSDAARPLLEAERLQRAAAKLGFDWPEFEPLWDKLAEEVAELREAIDRGDQDEVEAELGDLLFVLVNFSRFLNVDAGAALQRTNEKFIRRLRHVEQSLAAADRSWAEADMDELESLWQAAKK